MKKILFAVMAVVLCLGLMGAAFAYFSDTETSSGNTFTAGTLDLVLSDDDETDLDGVTATWMSPVGWAPGDTETATLTMKNVGSTGSYFVYLKPTDLVESDFDTPESEPAGSSNNIADWINITNFTITYRDTGTAVAFLEYGNWAPGWMTTCGAWGTTTPLTLAEFNSGIWWVVVWGSNRAPDDALEAGGANIIELEMIFQFEPTAPNDYQGDQCIMEFTVATGNAYPLDLVEIWAGSAGYGYVSLE